MLFVSRWLDNIFCPHLVSQKKKKRIAIGNIPSEWFFFFCCQYSSIELSGLSTILSLSLSNGQFPQFDHICTIFHLGYPKKRGSTIEYVSSFSLFPVLYFEHFCIEFFFFVSFQIERKKSPIRHWCISFK